METVTRSVLEELAEHGARPDAGLTDRLQRPRNMKSTAAALVALLVRVQRGGRVLEIGTSNGYSTIWIADAVRDHGGRLVSVEIEADQVRANLVRADLARAGLADIVQIVHDDAAKVLAAAPDASVSAVVLDAERPAYDGYWPDVVRILTAGGFVAVDNAVSHAYELTAFRAIVDATQGFRSDLFEIGDGVLVISRTCAGDAGSTSAEGVDVPGAGAIPVDSAGGVDAQGAVRPMDTAHERVRKRAVQLPPVGRHLPRRRPVGAIGRREHHGWVSRWTRLRGRPF